MATKDQYDTNGLPLAPAATPARSTPKQPPKTSGEPPLQWKGDVPQPRTGTSALQQATAPTPAQPTTPAQQPAPAWKNPDGQSVARMQVSGTSSPVFKNDIIDPKLNKEYGSAIYSGGKGFTEQSATTSGLDSAMQNAKRNTPFGEATSAQDFYGGHDVSKLTPQQYSQFKIDEMSALKKQQDYTSALNLYNTHTRMGRAEGLKKPEYEERLTNLQADVRGVPRSGQTASRSEQLADESRLQQRDLAKINAANVPENGRLDKVYPEFKTRPAVDPKLRPEIDGEVVKSLLGDDQTAYIAETAAKQAEYDRLLSTDQNMYDKNMKVTRLLMKQHGVERPSQLVGKVSDDEWDQYVSPLLSETASYAEGGVVQPPVYGAPPTDERALDAANGYREYAIRAESMGLPVVPFEQFSAMQAGALQGQPTGYAQGGMVEPEGDEFGTPTPESALGSAQGQGGKFVTDMNPNAPVDSVPAVVDGAQPAKLNSGEFVLPTDVVQFFGLDRLNRMIAQARKSSGETPQ